MQRDKQAMPHVTAAAERGDLRDFARAVVAVAARLAREQQARAVVQSGASRPSSTKEKAV